MVSSGSLEKQVKITKSFVNNELDACPPQTLTGTSGTTGRVTLSSHIYSLLLFVKLTTEENKYEGLALSYCFTVCLGLCMSAHAEGNSGPTFHLPHLRQGLVCCCRDQAGPVPGASLSLSPILLEEPWDCRCESLCKCKVPTRALTLAQ